MARKALSATKKAQLAREEHTELMARAVTFYQQEQGKPAGEKKMGLRRVCSHFEKQYFLEKGKRISLSYTTLRNLSNGGRVLATFNTEKSWLFPEEAEEVVAYVIEIASWGHGLSHRHLKEHVDQICRACLGNKFPTTGVSKQWTHRFVEHHSDRLHVYTSSPIDTACGQAVNEHTNSQWYDIVEETQLRGDDGKPIAPECTWAMNECGFQGNGGEGWERVIGAKGKKIQYQQQAGTRENMMVLVTIGANGMALPPAIIYAGKGYLVKWQQDNPAKAL